MLTLQNIGYSYGKGCPALHDVTGQIPSGIHLLVGENGAGKSTLLKLLAGILPLEKGDAFLNGLDMKRRTPDLMSRVFMMADNYVLPAETIRAFARSFSPFYPSFNAEVFDDCLKSFRLTGNERLENVSLGVRERSMISFAIALGVDLLLLDEPSNGLDIDSRKTFRTLLARYIGEGQTVIVSTHVVEELHSLYEGLLFLRDGGMPVCAAFDRITSRLAFVKGVSKVEDAVYQSREAGEFHAIVRNIDGGCTDIDISLLYSAMMDSGAETIYKLINDDDTGKQ